MEEDCFDGDSVSISVGDADGLCECELDGEELGFLEGSAIGAAVGGDSGGCAGLKAIEGINVRFDGACVTLVFGVDVGVVDCFTGDSDGPPVGRVACH
mmetsp:Transcript_26745/g.56489  ORF Transcript_26745/g.56489 Transcript_26745/m.56489 type:complete len:98 (-) Transcript_26745:513-806(-)